MGQRDTALTKRPTGIPGLDAVTGGGLPDAGGVLILGGPGSGKTVLGLQILASAIASAPTRRNCSVFSRTSRVR